MGGAVTTAEDTIARAQNEQNQRLVEITMDTKTWRKKYLKLVVMQGAAAEGEPPAKKLKLTNPLKSMGSISLSINLYTDAVEVPTKELNEEWDLINDARTTAEDTIAKCQKEEH